MFITNYDSFQDTLNQESYWFVILICVVVSLLCH